MTDLERLLELRKKANADPYDDWARDEFRDALVNFFDLPSTLAMLEKGERLYTKADMEAACELVRASNRLAERISIDKMVNRFLAWKLPDSVCSDPCATQRGYPHRSGTTLLTADEAKQMLMHVLSLHPNIAPDATAPSNHRDAERYRWLRDTAPWNRTVQVVYSADVGDDIALLGQDGLDAAIDAAKEQGHG